MTALPRRPAFLVFALAGICCQRQPPAASGQVSPNAGNTTGVRDGSAHASIEPRVPHRFPIVATACALDRAGKSVGAASGGGHAELTFYPGPGVGSDGEDKLCQPSTRMTETNSPVFGRIVGLEDVVHGICHPQLLPRTYGLGQGVSDACGTVTYSGENAVPRFSADPDPIHGAESALVRLTLEDHRGRAPACAAPAAPTILREEATVNGKPLLKRARYATGASTLSRPSPPPVLAVCPFFAQPGQTADREPHACEVGTYFLEDDSPLGKTVELRDWVDETCRAGGPPALGRRLYFLGRGKVDACGTIHYGADYVPEAGAGNGYPTYGLRLRFGYMLQMIDHRFRKRSPKCSSVAARVELIERAYNRPDGPAVLDRHLFAPREQK